MTTPTTLATSPWLRVPRPVPTPRVRLVCFPHAGGAASAFGTWANRLPGDIEVAAVQYPGRQDRIDDPCAQNMEEIVEAVADALRPADGAPLALFGHSMGAAVAHEVAREVERAGREVAHLFVSGRPAPGLRDGGSVHEGGDDALLADVRRLSGDVLADPALRELVLPSLRADYRLIESYAPSGDVTIDAPITACIGEDDAEVTRPEAMAWGDHTRGAFRLETFRGDHFYLVPEEAELLDTVAAAVAPVGRDRWPSTP